MHRLLISLALVGSQSLSWTVGPLYSCVRRDGSVCIDRGALQCVCCNAASQDCCPHDATATDRHATHRVAGQTGHPGITEPCDCTHELLSGDQPVTISRAAGPWTAGPNHDACAAVCAVTLAPTDRSLAIGDFQAGIGLGTFCAVSCVVLRC